MFPGFEREGVNNFLGYNDVSGDMPVSNERGLGLINVGRKQRFYSCRKGFGYYFINNITQTNRSKILR